MPAAACTGVAAKFTRISTERSIPLQRSFPALRTGLLLVAAAAVVIAIAWFWLLKKPELDFDPMIGRAFDPPVAIPAFSLVDHRGGEISDTSLAGRWTLAFFGFTFCPDVCPTALNEMAAVYTRIGGKPGEGATPAFLFFSVDPFRDTPEELARYLGHFNAGFVGVTGKPETIRDLVAALGLYYAYTDPDDDHVLDDVLQRPAKDYYGVIHSSRLLFISPQAELVAMMSPPFTYDNVREFLDKLRKHYGG